MAADILRYLYRHIKIAAKNVMANKAGYACFFAALFIIQTFFATMTLIMFSNDKSERARVEDEYDYHVALYGLNEDQMLMIENGSLIYYSADDVYEIVRTDKRYNAYTETYVYDYYFLLKGSDSAALRASYNRFHDNHFRQLVRLTREGDDPIVFEYTPLYNFGANLAVNHFIYAVSIAALAALSIFLLIVLYNIRINHYKFIYGIYMSFGADFKKLFETAFFEMLVVWALMLLPATAVSILCSYLIFAIRGIKFYFPAAMLLLTVVYGLFVLLVSVYFPMRIVSLRAPMSLIAAEDNSNLVSSPRRSFNIFGTKFPLLYEIFSTWRFRMYNLRLLVSAVIFTSLFISGLYIAEITRDTLAEEKPQFELDMSGAGIVFDDVMRDELYSIPGVSLVSKSNSAEAVYLDQHIRVPSELTRPFSNLVVPENMDGYRVTSDVVYRTIDDDIAAQLEKYDYDGDLYSPLHEPDTVVVSDSIGNTRKFNFKVGDTIEIATVRIRHAAVDPNMTGMALLREQLDKYEFDYHKYKIGAVIHDIPSLVMPIYMTDEAYEEITGFPVSYDDVYVYADPSLSTDGTRDLERALREWGMMYGGIDVRNTHALHLFHVNDDKQYDEIFTLVAALLLTISPMIWFFSQALYYAKRENEFTILQSIGATGSEIRRLYVFGGVFMGALAFIFCIALGYSLSYALYLIVNVLIPKWTLADVRYRFFMPWYAILLSVIMSVACGFLSAYFPYRSYMRKRSSTLEVEYSEVSE